MGWANDEQIVREALVRCSILDDQAGRMLDRKVAEGRFPVGFTDCQALLRFEPVPIKEGDRRHRDAEDGLH